MITEKRASNWRRNPRKEWYSNLKETTVLGPYEVQFTLGRPQPSFISFLAVGASPVYTCHVDGPTMRRKPIGTGPFKMVEWKPGDSVRLVKNPDYWKPGRPYLDAIEWRIVPSQATRTLAFVAGQFEMTGAADVTANTLKDIRAQAPHAVCETTAANSTALLLINHKAQPFDNLKLRRAISLALDRRMFVKSRQGDARLGGLMTSPPYGSWGLSAAQLEAVPGFGKDVERNRAEARKIMRELGYGPNNRLNTSYIVRTSTPWHLEGASLVADQLRAIYIEGEIEQKEISVYQGAVIKGAYTMAFQTTAAPIDDPDVVFYEGYTCASVRNYSHYCNREVEARIDEQSATVDPAKRKKLVQALDLFLQNDVVRPALYQPVYSACWQPYVKAYVKSANGNYTHNRMEDVWLDR
jgi:peptide/nickel transport system substrate-binding protein